MTNEIQILKKLFVQTDKNLVFKAISNFIQKYNLTQAEFDLDVLRSDYQLFQREERNGVLSSQEISQKNSQFGMRILKLIDSLNSPQSNATNMQISELKDLIAATKYLELFEILDTYFASHPDNQYSTIKQNIQHQIGQGFAPNPMQVQALQMFVGGEKVKKIIHLLTPPQTSSQSSTSNPSLTMTKQDYLDSIELLKSLPIEIKRTDLDTTAEILTKTKNLYFQYEVIAKKYESYIASIGEKYSFSYYSFPTIVQTSANIEAEVIHINNAIREFRRCFNSLNNPKNQDGLYVVFVKEAKLTEETQQITLFKNVINAIKSNNLLVYDMVADISISKLSEEIQNEDVKYRLNVFWEKLQAIHVTCSGMGRKKEFLDKILITAEIKNNIAAITDYLFK